jgi:hypothetical protein
MGRDAILGLVPRQTASGQAKPEQGTWGPTPNPIEGAAESGRAGTNGCCTFFIIAEIGDQLDIV